MKIALTEEEINVLLQHIKFMEEFDDDPTFRDHAETVYKKLRDAKLLNYYFLGKEA